MPRLATAEFKQLLAVANTPKFIKVDVHSRALHAQGSKAIHPPQFGLMFDIDGVIARGRKVLPAAVKAFQRLVEPSTGKFRVPTVFVTNAGNTLRHQKAQQLTQWLGVQISEDQVVMSHSPLQLFKEYHDKRVLVSGQGPTEEIAARVGFNKVTTMDQLRAAYPLLDCIDHHRRVNTQWDLNQEFHPVEAVLLLGEPVRWETHLQLLVDILITNGNPGVQPVSLTYPHIPVIACNMDLQWVAEAPIPRFGHGAFLCCLENLYKKITGKELIYSALVGKPSEITYYYAEHVLSSIAKKMGLAVPIKTLYTIGDNVNTDIYGANLYDSLLRRMRQRKKAVMQQPKQQLVASQALDNCSGRLDLILNQQTLVDTTERCHSILVKTGVYSRGECVNAGNAYDHSPRDFLPAEQKLMEPSYVTDNVDTAMRIIFENESFQ